MTRTILVCAVLATTVNLRAAEDDFGSALITGVGSAFALTPDDPGVVWMCPALTVFARSRAGASLSYRRHFDLADLDEMDASARYHVFERYSLSVAFARYGQRDLYLESRVTAAAGRRWGEHIATGIGIEYNRTEFGANIVSYSGASLSLSVAARLPEQFIAAASLRRITLDDYFDGVAGNPGVLGEVSVAWSSPPDITVGAVWSRAENDTDRFGVGQRLQLVEGLEFISGLRFAPVRYSLGGRIRHGMGAFDYVYLSHSDLGGTHTIGVSWRW